MEMATILSKIIPHLLMEKLITPENSFSSLQGNGLQKISISMRSLLLFLILTAPGCSEKNSLTKPVTPSSPNVPQSTEGADALARRLQVLEVEARQVDQKSLTEIQQLQHELHSKVDKTEVDSAVRTALNSESERIKHLHQRTDKAEARLRELEEHLGIMPRIPEAPWYKKK